MTTYKCIRGVVTSKGPIAIGETVEGLGDFEARVLIAQGKIVEAQAESAPEVLRTTEETGVTHRDPVFPKRKNRG
jgi:leucyl aminopeptidase (aminopeptidase T)